MTRPPLTALQPFLPPPADLSGLTDVELAGYLSAMGHRLRDCGLDHTCRLLFAAAERLERRNG